VEVGDRRGGIGLVDRQRVLALVGVGVEIERRRQAPTASCPQESMIAKVIVAVGDQNRECHAAIQLREPPCELGMILDVVAAELARDGLELAQAGKRRHAVVAVVDVVMGRIGLAQAQRTKANHVAHTGQKVPLRQPTAPTALAGRLERLAALHQHPPPAIRRGVMKDSKVAATRGRIAAARVQGQLGVDLQAPRQREIIAVVREADHLTASIAALAVERADLRRRTQRDVIEDDVEARAHD
jgi:hypothetical protein